MTADFNHLGGDALLNLNDYRRSRYQDTPSNHNQLATAIVMAAPNHQQDATWPLAFDMAGPSNSQHSSSTTASSPDESHQTHSPIHSPSAHSSPLQQFQHSPYQSSAASVHTQSPPLLTDWSLLQHQQQHPPIQDLSQFIQDSSLVAYNPFTTAGFPTALDYMPPAAQGLQLEQAFNNAMAPMDETTQAMQNQWEGISMANWQDFGASLQFPQDGLPRFTSLGSQSPTGTYLEVLSIPSSDNNSDHQWTHVNMFHNYEAYQQAQASNQAQNAPAIFNPSQTLHLRTNSDASQSDGNAQHLDFSSSWEEVSPFQYSPFSPGSDTYSDHRNCYHGETHHSSHEIVSPNSAIAPIPIKSQAPSSPIARTSPSSGSGMSSPSTGSNRRSSGPKKNPTGVTKATTKTVVRRISNGKKDGTGEKKVGRRKGPLLPEQRKQASEIRKLRACLRCKFLKKTCDKGEPCGGCQPSHARLWQVPCTRIDIKDIGYFMKDWKADYERHLTTGVSVYNVKGFATKETLMWITHGYGFCLPVMVREVFVTDPNCFQVDWVESYQPADEPIEFETRTEKLDIGEGGINTEALAEYLDKHVDNGFENFIDDHFEGTPFITEILKTAYRFYTKEKLPVIRKALKLVLAYNLTMHITLVEQQGDEHLMDGQIDDEESKYYGKYVAPVMINFQIKCAMADMWRELQKEILEELSSLYSSVYSGDRLKNWPTIFMLASILLAVWEEMQFDCHYRVPDQVAVEKFCSDMETTPVGVITGLFHAISQKLPALTDWDSSRHGHLLNNNPAVCEALTEVRQHVIKHESYLRTRNQAKFDRYDFDSLSNKFLSKLVIKSN